MSLPCTLIKYRVQVFTPTSAHIAIIGATVLSNHIYMLITALKITDFHNLVLYKTRGMSGYKIPKILEEQHEKKPKKGCEYGVDFHHGEDHGVNRMQ